NIANSLKSNIQAQSHIYNHFLAEYAPKEITRADSHKKDELRGIYNSIVKLSKESPLYLLTNDSSIEADAIGIKESARSLQGTIANLEDESSDSMIARKSAFTTDDSIVKASFIGRHDAEEIPEFSIDVENLATQQKNTGNYLPQDTATLRSGAYSFNVRVNDLSYEFQYSVRSGDTNQDIQERLERLINRSNIGLSAEILTNDAGETALSITSDDFGLPAGKAARFGFTEHPGSDMMIGTVDYLGLDKTEIAAKNATFYLDGNERSSTSNHFTVAQMYELQLLRAKDEGEPPVTVGVKDDNASMIDRTKELIGSYNSFLDSIKSFRNAHFKGTRITNEVTAIAKQYHSGMEALGLSLTADGHIDIDSEKLGNSATNPDQSERGDFRPVKDFANALQQKMDAIVLDPMHYIERPVVAYKNPGHGFSNPYITSEYSGMMFNGYC
nr:flagellar filament capping protein FliD [Lachnospiraceae bacterium]